MLTETLHAVFPPCLQGPRHHMGFTPDSTHQGLGEGGEWPLLLCHHLCGMVGPGPGGVWSMAGELDALAICL